MYEIELRQKQGLIVSPVFDLVINGRIVGNVYIYSSCQNFVTEAFNYKGGIENV